MNVADAIDEIKWIIDNFEQYITEEDRDVILTLWGRLINRVEVDEYVKKKEGQR